MVLEDNDHRVVGRRTGDDVKKMAADGVGEIKEGCAAVRQAMGK